MFTVEIAKIINFPFVLNRILIILDDQVLKHVTIVNESARFNVYCNNFIHPECRTL